MSRRRGLSLLLLLMLLMMTVSAHAISVALTNLKRDSQLLVIKNKTPAGSVSKEAFALESLHNKLRATVQPSAANMEKMEWDDSLAQVAHEWAAVACENPRAAEGTSAEIPEKPGIQGPGAGGRGGGQRRLGVNLHRAPHGATSFASVLASWFSEGQNYDYARPGCAPNRTCRHYTQMVWASASRVGCAKRWCRDPGSRVEAFACVYLPGGNWLLDGKTIAPYKAGDWCSLCTSVKSGCFKHQGAGGLCEVPQNRCRMNCGRHGHLDSASCRCSCASGFSGKYCQVKCAYPCVHGRYREEECSCVCNLGYGGLTCAERAEFPYHSCSLRVEDECLSVSVDRETFYTARNQCQGRGGTLAQIESQREQDLLSFYLLRATDSNDVTGLEPESNSFWIGLTYKVSKGVFRWDDGRAVNFSSFALGQPDSHGFGNCVVMHAESGFNWNDRPCRSRNRFICQFGKKHRIHWSYKP
ncbi:C-type lectin domain family 18 member A-like isoform X1 [Petromyzon marinus]|uniref:C-type lectin domain family 18 member A-like isoform X1 n=1 Tax=Petromyzon marinus TaxID=7757 RepID=UPI003F707395